MKKIILCLLLMAITLPSFAANYPTSTARPMIFFQNRSSAMRAKVMANHTSWTYMKGRADAYLTGDINALYAPDLGMIARAQALTWHMTGDTAYRDRAKAMLWARYFDTGTPLWNYQNLNTWRAYLEDCVLAYDLLYNDLSEAEKTQAINAFKIWGAYWVNYADTTLLATDTDQGTSTVSHFNMLGLALWGDDGYATTMLDKADSMTTSLLLNTYMNSYMAGGVWAEGSSYSPSTMTHWMMQFLANKEIRGIDYPNNYADLAVQAQIHMIYPNKNGYYSYGDIETISTNYEDIAGRGHFKFMLIASQLIADISTRKIAKGWIESATRPSSATNNGYGTWEFMFRDASPITSTPSAENWLNTFASTGTIGLEFVATRTGWDSTDTVLYFLNDRYRVDHQHQDSLDFAIVRGSDVLTKEATGYQGASWRTNAHNSILIQNDQNGNSAPLFHTYGQGTTKTETGPWYVYINGEAADHYNTDGFFSELYTNEVRRQILFAPPLTIVADRIKISTASNCTWNGTTHSTNVACAPRWKKLIQHFPSQPSLSDGVYSAIEGTSKIFYKPLLPTSNISIIDESVLWSSSTESELPVNQRKWQLEISPQTDANTLAFLNVIYTTDSGTVAMPSTTNINTVGMQGVIVSDSTPTVFLFGKDGTQQTTVTYTASYSSGVIGNHLISDMRQNSYHVFKDSVEISGSPFTASAQGVLSFSITGGGTFQITESADLDSPTTTSNKSGRQIKTAQNAATLRTHTLTCSDNVACTETLYCLATTKGGTCTPSLTYSAPFKVGQNLPWYSYCFSSTDGTNAEAAKCSHGVYQRRQ